MAGQPQGPTGIAMQGDLVDDWLMKPYPLLLQNASLL
jgi:hypothetical protein